MIQASRKLLLIKLIHTLAWGIIATCIFAMPYFAWRHSFTIAAILAIIVMIEILTIILNHWTCPLTPVAAKFTEDRRPNFDIFLPEWLAKHNKFIFGIIFVLGLIYSVFMWLYSSISI